MSVGRWAHTETLLLDGRVLITGGDYGGDDLATAEIYDPATGRFSPTGSMTVGRSSHTAALLDDGRVLIEGGGPDGTSAEIYWP
jgi:hypothetical protein